MSAPKNERRMKVSLEIDFYFEGRFNRKEFNERVERIIHQAFPAVVPPTQGWGLRLVYLATEDGSEPMKLSGRVRS